MLHAQAVSNGGEFDWVNVPEPTEEDFNELDSLFNRNVDNIFK